MHLWISVGSRSYESEVKLRQETQDKCTSILSIYNIVYITHTQRYCRNGTHTAITKLKGYNEIGMQSRQYFGRMRTEVSNLKGDVIDMACGERCESYTRI